MNELCGTIYDEGARELFEAPLDEPTDEVFLAQFGEPASHLPSPVCVGEVAATVEQATQTTSTRWSSASGIRRSSLSSAAAVKYQAASAGFPAPLVKL